jgi:hypothetical protein
MRTAADLPWPLKHTKFVAKTSQVPIATTPDGKYSVFRETRNSLKSVALVVKVDGGLLHAGV